MRIQKTVTLKAVAERAGTSIQTVSTVLNDSRSNTVVSAETRARILSVAEEMQYRRNPLARSLRRGYTNIIGFYAANGTISPTNPFIAEVFGGIQTGCNEHYKDLLIHGAFRGNSVDDIYDEVTSGKIDGLVVYAPNEDSLIRRLRSAPLPVVAIADPVTGLRSVAMDDWDGGRQAAGHLHALGHRNILFRQPPNLPVSAERRLEGLNTEASRLGMAVTTITMLVKPRHGVSEYEHSLLESAAENRPTAAVCWCDASAQYFLNYLCENGVSVPKQMAVMGFDGFDLPYAGGAHLTTVLAPWAEAGRRAVSVLLDSETFDGESQKEILYPMSLRRGDTT